MKSAQQKAQVEQEMMEQVAKSFHTAMKGIGKINVKFSKKFNL